MGGNIYYVSSSTSADCPQPCHPLSYYVTDTASFFTSDATFVFMEGEHLLHTGLAQVAINDIHSLILRGERGHSNTNVIITCSRNTRGMVFNNGGIVTIYDITITGCGQLDISPLSLININTINIHYLTIYNNTMHTNGAGGLYIQWNSTSTHNKLTIANSIFAHNIIRGDGGGLYINPHTGTHTDITIASSIFTHNTIYDRGCGLCIDITRDGLHLPTKRHSYNYLTIASSRFTDNKIKNTGGGCYLKFNSSNSYSYITIESSKFINNKVGSGGGCYIWSGNNTYNDIMIANSMFTNHNVGLGGGLALVSRSKSHNNITIANSNFTDNEVGDGGGCYIQPLSGAYNYIAITSSIFSGNNFTHEGGGLSMYFHVGANSNIIVTNSTFTNNAVSVEGGSLMIFSDLYSQTQINLSNCTFSYNYAWGSDIGCMYGLHIKSKSDTHVIITNSTITNNHGFGGLGIVTTEGQIKLSQVKLSDNHGSAIETTGRCKIIFTEGHSVIANNSSPTDGGGMYLDIGSSLTTTNGGHVSFINNTAKRYGGAIYSFDKDEKKLKRFFLIDDVCSVYNLSATFINNSAVRAGDVLYNGLFIFCLSSNKYNINDIVQCPGVPASITNSTSIHPLSTVSSDPLVVCPCVNNTVNCTSMLDRDVCLYPGQILQVSLATVGLCGGISPGAIVVTSEAKEINLLPGNTTDYTSTTCRTLNYTIKLNTYISNTILTIDVADGILYGTLIRSMKVNLTILDCPLGLVLDFTSGDCVCSNEIIHLSGIHCNILWMPYPIARSGKYWISHKNGKYNCTIAHTGCPFDYCNASTIKLSLRESDLQCNYNRSGVLCGQCKQGLSLMIGSNRCANCTDTTPFVSISIFIILPTVAGIMLVIFLIALNLTVAVGSINGLLFYTNIVKLNESIFFSQGNIPVISQFISWCNLDLGIEYCFIDGLDGYIKTWLQFAFPVYVWVLVVIFIVACRYSGRLFRLTGHNAVPVLATLILMSYTKLSRTVTNALMMNTIRCGEYRWKVWNVDANIHYLSAKHAILFTVSLLFLITGLVYTGLVFCSQWLQHYSGKCCKSTRDPVVYFKPLIDAYTGPFKDKFRFWAGLCLIVRVILTVVFSFTTILQSKLNNFIILLAVGTMVVFIVGGRVYKDRCLTVVETFSLVNLLCLCLLVNLFTNESYQDIISINEIVSASVSIEMLLFAIIFIVHCYLVFKKVFPNFRLCCGICVQSEELPLISEDREIEDGSQARVITRREELIYDCYLTQEHP